MTCPCGKRTHAGTYLCNDCSDLVDRLLADVNAHYGELANLRLGYDRFGSGAGSRPLGEAMPLIIDLRFVTPTDVRDKSDWTIPGTEGQGTAAMRRAHHVLGSAARRLLVEHGTIPGPVCVMCLHTSCARVRRHHWPAPSVASVTAYLHNHVSTIRGRPWALEFLPDLVDLERRLRGLVDRPADRWYAGPCDCGTHLYAKAKAPVVQCRTCGASFDVGVRRDFMLEVAEDYIATATEIARAVSWLGAQPLSADRVYKWAERGRIQRKGVETCPTYGLKSHPSPCRRCRPLYRIGDAIDLLAEDTRKDHAS